MVRACALSLAVLQAWRSGTGDGGGAGFLEYPIRSQNDASEFLGKVVDALQEELKGTSHAEGLALALGCKSSVVKLCRRCGAKTVGREEISTITPVSIQDMERRYETLEQALARHERGPSPSPLSLWLAWARVLPPGCPPGYCLPGIVLPPGYPAQPLGRLGPVPATALKRNAAVHFYPSGALQGQTAGHGRRKWESAGPPQT